MADDTFKLPRSSYEELSKIIKAYGRAKGEGSLDAIAQLSGIGRTNVSGNNAFLVAVEIIEGGRTKSTTAKGQELARALDHEIEVEVARAWRNIITENDFLNKMVQAISVRKGMEPSHLENHIAYSAGEGKSKNVMTGARAVVEILQVSGLVIDNGIKLVANSEIDHQEASNIVSNDSNSTLQQTPRDTQFITVHKEQNPAMDFGGFSLQIQLRINASVDELDGLGDKIKSLMNGLSSKNSEQDQEIES